MNTLDDEGTSKSQKHVKGQDKRIQEILKRNSFKNDNEVTKLETELLGVQMDNDEFETLLPQFGKEEKAHHNNGHWNDVNSEDLMNVYDSFIEDPELKNDPNLPLN